MKGPFIMHNYHSLLLACLNLFRESNENIALFKSQQALNHWIQIWNQQHQDENKSDNIQKNKQCWETLLSSSLEKTHEIDFDQSEEYYPL